jgi:hypothetical protein
LPLPLRMVSADVVPLMLSLPLLPVRVAMITLRPECRPAGHALLVIVVGSPPVLIVPGTPVPWS